MLKSVEEGNFQEGLKQFICMFSFKNEAKVTYFYILLCLNMAFYNRFVQKLVKMKAKPYLFCSSDNLMQI